MSVVRHNTNTRSPGVSCTRGRLMALRPTPRRSLATPLGTALLARRTLGLSPEEVIRLTAGLAAKLLAGHKGKVLRPFTAAAKRPGTALMGPRGRPADELARLPLITVRSRLWLTAPSLLTLAAPTSLLALVAAAIPPMDAVQLTAAVVELPFSALPLNEADVRAGQFAWPLACLSLKDVIPLPVVVVLRQFASFLLAVPILVRRQTADVRPLLLASLGRLLRPVAANARQVADLTN